MNKAYRRPDQIKIPDWYSLQETGISQSKVQDWLQCKRLFAMKMAGYGNPLKEIQVGFGNCVHQILDWIYSAQEMPDKRGIIELVQRYEDEFMQNSILSPQDAQIELGKAQGILWGYVDYYHDEFVENRYYDPEHVFNVDFNGYNLKGKIDIRYKTKKGEKYIEDHKTKGRIEEDNIIKYLPLDIQSLFYLLADEIETGERAKGIIYNVVRNPGSKPWVSKNETIEAFMHRMYEESLKRPDHYFKRWKMEFVESDMQEYKLDLMEWLDEIDYFIRRNKKPRPSRKCLNPYKCEFLDQCSGKHLNELSVGNSPFPELEINNGQRKKIATKKKVALKKKTLKRLKAKVGTKSSRQTR